MILISKEDVQEMLVETSELPSYAFRVLDEKLNKIKQRAVIRECDKCFGASFGDCQTCDKIVLTSQSFGLVQEEDNDGI